MAESITPLIQSYTVDFASNNNFLFIKSVQGDGHTTRYADISLMNAGQPYIVNDDAVTVVIRGTKPDGTEIFNTCKILDDHTIRVEITQQMSAVPGKVNCEISIMSNTENRVLTSFPFMIIVESSAFDVGYITSSNEFTLLIEKINAASQATEDAKEATADLKEFQETAETAESKRVTAEENRVKAEDARVEAEEARVSAEEGRVKAEEDRVKAEQGRVMAEQERVEAENEREQAEQQRQQTMQEFDENLEMLEGWKDLAHSYANGGSGKRPGEETDNAKYYKEQAEQAAHIVAESTPIVAPTFRIDFETMELMQIGQGMNLTFEIDENMDLVFSYTIGDLVQS